MTDGANRPENGYAISDCRAEFNKMNMKKTIPFCFLCCICFSSCAVMSKNPLSDPNEPVFDTRLKGLWGAAKGGESLFLHIGRDKDDRTQIIYVEHRNDGSLELRPLTMFPTVIERNFFMNVRFLNEKGAMTKDAEDYIFVKYDFPESNNLSISMMNFKEVASAIEQGDIFGIIPKRNVYELDEKSKGKSADDIFQSALREDDTNGRSVISGAPKITDRSENIVKYIESADLGKLFPGPIILRKIQ